MTTIAAPVRAVTCSTPGARRLWARIIVWSPLLIAATVAQLYRQTGLAVWRTIWAEDGGTFFTGTANLGHLLDPHAGYAQVIPRVLGLAGHLVPIHDLAWYDAIAGAVLDTLRWGGVEVHRPARPLDRLTGGARAQCRAGPTMILEQLGNGVNTIWAVAFAAWWAVLYRPTSSTDAATPAAIVFLAVVSQASPSPTRRSLPTTRGSDATVSLCSSPPRSWPARSCS